MVWKIIYPKDIILHHDFCQERESDVQKVIFALLSPLIKPEITKGKMNQVSSSLGISISTTRASVHGM
jgi:hypothetical protein